MFAALLLFQAVQPAPAAALPDIQLDVRATAQRVVVENRGRTALELRTSVNGREGEGNIIDIQAPELPQGQRELNDVEVRVRAEARIGDPQAVETASPQQEPASPQ